MPIVIKEDHQVEITNLQLDTYIGQGYTLVEPEIPQVEEKNYDELEKSYSELREEYERLKTKYTALSTLSKNKNGQSEN